MKIIAIRIGDRYASEYEKYLEEKLHNTSLYGLENLRDDVLLQWNKMYGMSLDINGNTIVVMDIDVLLVNNYDDLFNYLLKVNLYPSLVGGVIQKIKDIR